MPSLADLYADENLNDAERELTALFVQRVLRSNDTAGGVRRAVSFREILEALWREASCLEAQALAHGLKSSAAAETFDAAANMILAVSVQLNDVRPLLEGFGKKVKAARYGTRG